MNSSSEKLDRTRRSGRGCLIAIGVFFGILILIGLSFILAGRTIYYEFGSVFPGNKVAVVHINGEIGGGTASGVDPEYVVRLLRKAEKDPLVRAVVLRINSPGGTAASSQEIASEIKKMSKPVVASIGDTGASGAYWIASACDKIVCNPASSLGSIGVIITIPSFEELFKKLGIKYVVISKGKFKDLGNPARELTDEEKKLLEQHAEKVYQQFIEAVSENRSIPRSTVERLATGEVFLGEDAVELGLADETGNFNDAVELAADLAGIEGEPEVEDLDLEVFNVFNLLRYFLSAELEKLFSTSIVPVVR